MGKDLNKCTSQKSNSRWSMDSESIFKLSVIREMYIKDRMRSYFLYIFLYGAIQLWDWQEVNSQGILGAEKGRRPRSSHALPEAVELLPLGKQFGVAVSVQGSHSVTGVWLSKISSQRVCQQSQTRDSPSVHWWVPVWIGSDLFIHWSALRERQRTGGS